MTYRVRLTRNAQRDRDRILAWHDAEAPDRGEWFIDEFYATARRLQDLPQRARGQSLPRRYFEALYASTAARLER